MSTKRIESLFSPWLILLAAGLIILAALGTYHNSFGGPFILDDTDSIPKNPTIRQLFSIKEVLSPPTQGQAVQNRPIVNFSLAIDYWFGGLEVTSYHVSNLIMHVLAGLALFGVVRRTLRLPIMPEVLRGPSTGLALVIALIWTVHPLQTNAVTYVIQRTELLVGLFYLLTLYCVIRGDSSTRSVFWYAAAVISCVLGMGSKEVMVLAPLLIFLYDRVFLCNCVKEVFRRRWALYVGLGATWGLIIALHIVNPYVSQRALMGPLDYASRQFEAITTYLKLCFWPGPLILDYGPGKTPSFWQALPHAIFVIALLIATLVGVRYKPRIGFLGVWFFCLLAPSSSFVALNEWAAEKRMYLPLAAVVVAVVLGGYALLARRARLGRVLGYILVGAVVVVFGLLTIDRNYDYVSEISIWDLTIHQVPDNHRAYANRGFAYSAQGDYDLAIRDYDKALELNPSYAYAYNNRGLAYGRTGKFDLAIRDFDQAVALHPELAEAHNNRGMAYKSKGSYNRAIRDFGIAIELNPRYAEAYYNQGLAYSSKGERDKAILEFERALQVAQANSDQKLARYIKSNLELYKAKHLH